ncbi:MlaD family protein [Almyronema epifaneia]|uniref:MlaD family protein n=1 Tax=Almyronema epifaneia S1 TaxID=2991925 RepID=A0ABW6ID73_9CYAN
MRARTIREGSVGLLILVGVGLFGVLVLWLRGLNPGQRSYRVLTDLENAEEIQIGTVVFYRGVPVGRIIEIDPGTNAVDIEIEITKPDFIIPSESVVETNQSGLIGETTVAIIPQERLPESALAMSPFGNQCDSSIIVCDGDRLPSAPGLSYDTLIRSADEIASALSDPELIEEVKVLVRNTSVITRNVVDLSDELTELTREVRREVAPVTATTRQTLLTASAAAAAAGEAARQVQLTAAEANSLLIANRASVVTTLNNLSASSDRLLSVVNSVAPTVEEGELISNLEILSSNAAAASDNLRSISQAFNTPENLVMLQQTLESARNVFQSAEKIMADVDELTGDPDFRNNIRNLVNGLSGLVSSTNTLQEQTQLAQVLEPASQDSTPAVTFALQPLSQDVVNESLKSTSLPIIVRDGQPYVLRAIYPSTPKAQPNRTP